MTKIKSIALVLVLILIGASGEADEFRVPQDIGRIQAAVNGAKAGDTIVVGKGSYRENVKIGKPLTLRAEGGPGETVVTALDPRSPVFELRDTEGVTLEGFTATGSKVVGIVLRGVGRSTVRGNRAVENLYGIALYSSDENSIIENSADSNALFGIYMERSARNTLRGNTASRNGDKGIFLSFSDGNAITGNSANKNTWNGIILWSSNKNTITDNRVLRNTYGLVTAESVGNEISGNITIPNVFIIAPILLIYLGVVLYIIQRWLLRVIYRD